MTYRNKCKIVMRTNQLMKRKRFIRRMKILNEALNLVYTQEMFAPMIKERSPLSDLVKTNWYGGEITISNISDKTSKPYSHMLD